MPLSLSEQNTLGPLFQEKHVKTDMLKCCWFWFLLVFFPPLKKNPKFSNYFHTAFLKGKKKERKTKPNQAQPNLYFSMLAYTIEFYIKNILLVKNMETFWITPVFLM